MNKKKLTTETSVHVVYVYDEQDYLIDSVVFAYRKDAESYVMDNYDEEDLAELATVINQETVWIYR